MTAWRTKKGMRFSTIDVDNDLRSGVHCAARDKFGGWWYRSCASVNLNGLYGTVSSFGGAIYWLGWQGYIPKKTTSMMVKRHP
jgi:hypothetical protein